LTKSLKYDIFLQKKGGFTSSLYVKAKVISERVYSLNIFPCEIRRILIPGKLFNLNSNLEEYTLIITLYERTVDVSFSIFKPGENYKELGEIEIEFALVEKLFQYALDRAEVDSLAEKLRAVVASF
jgi:hypothetical protein